MKTHACVGVAASAGLHWSDAMRHTHLTQALAMATASAMLVAGCTSDGHQETVTAIDTSSPETTQAEPSPSPLPSPSASETTLPDASPPVDETPFFADRLPDTAEASADARLSPVRL